jgi:hypothetical protein
MKKFVFVLIAGLAAASCASAPHHPTLASRPKHDWEIC